MLRYWKIVGNWSNLSSFSYFTSIHWKHNCLPNILESIDIYLNRFIYSKTKRKFVISNIYKANFLGIISHQITVKNWVFATKSNLKSWYFLTLCQKSYIQTMASLKSNNLSFTYQWFMTSGCTDKGIWKFEFKASKTHFVSRFIWFFYVFNHEIS